MWSNRVFRGSANVLHGKLLPLLTVLSIETKLHYPSKYVDLQGHSSCNHIRFQLKKGRIEVPVRSIHCRPHFECVDLRAYLDYEAKNSATVGAASSTRKSQRPLWTCPVCGERARADDLRIDE